MTQEEIQGETYPVVGTQSLHISEYTCEGAISGDISWQLEFQGIEKVTVPVGTFTACRFLFGRARNLQATCGQGTSGGQAADPLILLWAVEGLGIVKSSSAVNGSTVELVGY